MISKHISDFVINCYKDTVSNTDIEGVHWLDGDTSYVLRDTVKFINKPHSKELELLAYRSKGKTIPVHIFKVENKTLLLTGNVGCTYDKTKTSIELLKCSRIALIEEKNEKFFKEFFQQNSNVADSLIVLNKKGKIVKRDNIA